MIINFLRPIVLFLILSTVLFACKNETKQKLEISSTSQNTSETIGLIENPSRGNSALPRLFGNEKELFMSWVEQKDSLSVLYFSSFKDGRWSKALEVNSGTDWFINWADFPAIAENNGNIIVSYLQKSANGKYTYDAKINLYSAVTQTWKNDILLHNDGTASEHGFVSVVPQGKSSFFAVWLDGRNTMGSSIDHQTHGIGAMTLRGRIIHADGTMEDELALDNRVCDCCQTAMVSIQDAPVIVYRDRTENEVRDISRIAPLDDSFSPSQPIYRDNWKIAACPVNGPAIASFDKSVAVAWFTAVNNLAKVQVVFSNDMGKTFGSPIQINDNETLGRVDVVMVSEEAAIVSWMEKRGDETSIQVMRVSADGNKEFPITLSNTSFERSSGFPQLEISNNSLYAAWTMVDGKKTSIKTAKISLSDL